jgi:CSLREA domain-containing protein
MTRNRPGPRTARLHLEYLEDRSVPSTFTVNTTLDDVTPANGKFSLREAITKANTTPGADVIVLPAGVFKVTIPGTGDDGNLTGDFDITDDVTIRGAGAGLTVIDGQQLDRVFDVIGNAPSSIKVVYQGLAVRDGSTGGDGGGIQVANADLVLRDCAVTGNRASGAGGGIRAIIGSPNVALVRTTVARNLASFGGGINATTAALTDSTVRRNLSDTGGGIHATTITLTGSTVSGNSAGNSGGGIHANTITLTGSTVSGNSAGFGGGGINGTTVTLTRCTVSGNSSQSGAGISGVIVTLTNSSVTGNSAVGFGGGISATTANVTNSTVSGNSALGFGGGISATTANVTNSTVSGNSAVDFGGGINATTANVTRSTVSGNSVGGVGNGGGINAGIANVTNSTVSDNSASFEGGGIWASEANATNCTVSGNTAKFDGGGVFAVTATILNCTVVENLAHTGGGLFDFPDATLFIVKNTIVALNLTDSTGTSPDVAGAFASQGHNLIGDGTGSTGFVGSDLVGTSLDAIDPLLGPLANNGGRTKTHKLLAGSPCIDAGDNSLLPPTDQRGFPRKKDGNGDGSAVVDIGAFEK